MVVRHRVVGIKDSSKTVVRKSDTGQHLQLKSSIKGALGGHQNVLNRAISCLTVEYRVSDKKTRRTRSHSCFGISYNVAKVGYLWINSAHLNYSLLIRYRGLPSQMFKLEQKYFTQLCNLRRSYNNSKKLMDLANLRKTNLGFDTKAEHEQHAP